MRRFTITLFAVALAVGGAGACAPATQGSGATSGPRHAAAPLSFAQLPKIGMRATCPVMGHAFTIQKGTAFSVHKGRYYVFCCPGCKPKFEADPARYLKR